MNETLESIDTLGYTISDALREDLTDRGGISIEKNTRHLALRYIWHLIHLKIEIEYQHEMNFDVGYQSLEYIAHKNGKTLGYDGKVGIPALNLMPSIEAEMDNFRDIMGYTKQDIVTLIMIEQ